MTTLQRKKTILETTYSNTIPSLTLIAATTLSSIANADIETVTVTANRYHQSLNEQTASISVVGLDQLELIAHTHINEALSQVPGAWISRGNGQEHLTAIRSPVLTGAGSCGAFYIAEDNIPVRATGFCNVNQLFDINTEQAQQIEVLRGPGMVIHGSDALHGVINVVSRAPSEQAEGSLSLEAGPHDYGRIKFSHSDTVGKHGYRISFNSAHDGGYKDNSGFDQQKLSARHDFQSGDLSFKTLLSVTNINQETAGFVVGTDAYKDESRKRENPNPEAFRDSQSVRLQTRISKALKNSGEFIVTPYARYTDMDFMMHFLPGTPLEENGQASAGVQSIFYRPISDKTTLSQGVDIEITDAWLEQSQEFGFSSFPAGKQYDYEVDAELIAAFISADHQATEALTLSSGIRYEFLEYDYDNRMIDGNTAEDGSICVNGFTNAVGCRYSRPADSTDSFENVSIQASARQIINDNLSTHIRLSHGFRAPQATELYRLQAGQNKADLESEEIDSIEWGLQGRSFETKGSLLDYSLTAFYMEKDNVIFQNSDRLNIDDGETKHYGLEYQLGWQINPQWQLSAAGTFSRQKYTNDVSTPGPGGTTIVPTSGNDIDTAPRRMSSVKLNWQPTLKNSIELEWLAMGSYYTNITNQNRYDGHDLLHLRIQHRVSDNLSLRFRINNLTDKDYAERADFSTFAGDRYFIGEPRSFYGEISLNY